MAQNRTNNEEAVVSPVYVLYGKERRQVTDALGDLVDSLLGDADEQLALTEYEGGQAQLAEVLDTVRTLPFLTERRVVVVRDADAFISEYREGLEAYLERPSETGVLVLVAGSFSKSTRLYKKVAPLGGVMACEPVDRRQLGGFLAQYAQRRHGVKLDPGAARLLVELVGEEVGMLCSEVDKLSVYVSEPGVEGASIIPRHVEEAVGNYRVHTVFEVIGAMTAGQAGAALERLDQILNQSRDIQFKAVGAFAWQFRRLFEGRKLLDQGLGFGEIAKRLRLWRSEDQFLAQLRRLSLAQIGGCLQDLARIDQASKSGGNVRRELERFIMEFCGRAVAFGPTR